MGFAARPLTGRGNMAGAGEETLRLAASQWSGPFGVWFASWRTASAIRRHTASP
jgi:hypothetical protein